MLLLATNTLFAMIHSNLNKATLLCLLIRSSEKRKKILITSLLVYYTPSYRDKEKLSVLMKSYGAN
jgi:hypothetical protein